MVQWTIPSCMLNTRDLNEKKNLFNFLQCSCWRGPLESVSGWAAWKWSFHPAMWCPLRTWAPLHVCIYPVTQIRQDPIHLSKQLENMGFLWAHRASESNSPWSELPNIPERLNIWYQIPLKAYNFQWLLTLEAYRWKRGLERSSLICLVVFPNTAVIFTLHFLCGERKKLEQRAIL